MTSDSDEGKDGEALRLQDAVGRIEAAMDYAAEARLRSTARRARTSAKRLIWLQRAADLVQDVVLASKAVPCGSGCSHCCAIPVAITQAEAFAIADFAKLPRPSQPAAAITGRGVLAQEQMVEDARDEAALAHMGEPCTFLADGGHCSVYPARPLACRLHFSLSTNSDDCRPDYLGQSPRLDVFDRNLDNILTLGLSQPVADIRDWFAQRKQV
jgi:Fe-S-cluster containining protein